MFSDRDDVRRNDHCRAIIREPVVRDCLAVTAKRTRFAVTGGKKGGLIKTIKFLRRADEEATVARQP